ncbi:NirD/YgiW/YdeI family stress tolerance protein [Acinetobacter sp. CFCC 10889]|uniref:NirD/YgiW/YdeI family stress tolerance protein n=1 Tax=Acinetobacter sp. CFCC 10889 TaxID=1775557 RepID=UPI000DD04065|nr:NirD/YgiW/YdeI family stress tolerance protein [Acinetobacter sp. CFCC 10889]
MKLITKTALLTTLFATTTFAIANNTALNNAAINNTAVNSTVNQSALYSPSTVKQALTLKDDTKVQLRGHVVKAIGDEKYQFRDQTGTITVDIDDDLWNGKAISATTLITISGEVDVDYQPTKRVEIDVDAVKF